MKKEEKMIYYRKKKWQVISGESQTSLTTHENCFKWLEKSRKQCVGWELHFSVYLKYIIAGQAF